MSDPGEQLADGVKSGVGAASTGAAVGAAIGAVVPPPFNAVAAPFGALLGAAIGLFSWLARASAEDAAAAEARMKAFKERNATANAEAVKAASFLSAVGDALAKDVIAHGWAGNPQQQAIHIAHLNRFVIEHPSYGPIVNNFETALRNTSKHPSAKNTASYKAMKALIDGIGSVPGNIDEDPFVYLRPPLSKTIGPGLAALGINIADPKTVALIRDNYDGSLSVAATPRIKLGIPITRKSKTEAMNMAAGSNRYAVDARAFNAKVAPYGVSSLAANGFDGTPLKAPWPYGLDADRFALPKPKGPSAGAKLAATGGAAALGYLIFFV